MTGKLIALAERRAGLVAKAANQRAELSGQLASWRSPLAIADQGLLMIRYIRKYAVLLVGIATFVTPLRVWRSAKWVQRGWLVWRLAKKVKKILPFV